MAAAATEITVLFDTRCVLCSRFVRFLLAHEADDRIRFVGAWTETGQAIAARYGLGRDDLERSYLVIADGRPLLRSDAGIALMRQMKAPWRRLAAARIVPRAIRDAVYDLVARNRYRWFGTLDTCLVPSAATRARFTLD